MVSKVTLEREVSFSESLLWKLQNDAYSQYGPAAWSEKGVPTYLTCHPITAHGYAQTSLAFLNDTKTTDPVTIIDLGAGTGRFAYLYLNELLPHIDRPFRYIATDVAAENLEFIKQHPLAKKCIETVLYRHDQKVWDIEIPDGPVIVIANYYFDTVPQALYKAENGQLFEGMVTLQIDEEYNSGGVDMIPHLEASYSYKPAKSDEVLSKYAQVIKDGTFIIPSGGLQSIDFIRHQVKGPMLLLAADQGVCTLSQAHHFKEPKIAKHGTFSVTVSYHFLHWYFQQYLGGLVATTDNPDPAYVILAATLGLKDFSQTAQAFSESISANEPHDYCRISEALEQAEPDLETILSIIRMGRYDPINTYLFFQRMRTLLQQANPVLKDRLCYALRRVRENFYPISREEGEFLLNLGVLFHDLGEYNDALYCFESSVIYTGPNEQVVKNILACKSKSSSHDIS